MRIDFYLIPEATEDARCRTACRIIEKAYHLGKRVYVQCIDKAHVAFMNSLLWTFNDISFVPHEIYADNTVLSGYPVLIGELSQKTPAGNYAVFANLTPVLTLCKPPFERMIEVISAEPAARSHARERYRTYREQGFELYSHQL